MQQRRACSSVRLEPAGPAVAAPAVAAAIAAADQVVLGPGSLFTSVLAAAIVPDVRDALAATAGPRVYVANLARRCRRPTGSTVADHVARPGRATASPVDVVVVRPPRPLGPVAGGVQVVDGPVADDRPPCTTRAARPRAGRRCA